MGIKLRVLCNQVWTPLGIQIWPTTVTVVYFDTIIILEISSVEFAWIYIRYIFRVSRF